MSKEKRKSKLSVTECKKSVYDFFELQMKFKNIQSQYDEAKVQFNNFMEDYFKQENISKSLLLFYDELVSGAINLSVSRVQKSSVEFNPDKLEKAIGKKNSEYVIIKKYEIIDMSALIAYLKECNVDPKIFKSFIHTSKSVDIKELDKLEELGKITAEQIKDCYTVKHQKPYFTVKVKRGYDDEETRR